MILGKLHFGLQARQAPSLLMQPRSLLTNQATSFVKCVRAAPCSRVKRMAVCWPEDGRFTSCGNYICYHMLLKLFLRTFLYCTCSSAIQPYQLSYCSFPCIMFL